MARPAMVFAAAAAVSVGMASPALAHTGEHRVDAGDTLSRLATAHGTSWQSIYAENRGSIGADPNRLRIGQTLVIGGGGATTPAPSATGQYVVRAGDTLNEIAVRHGTTWQQLHAINRNVLGANPNVLRVGQGLALSGTAAPAAAVPQRASRGTERVAPAAPAAPAPAAPVASGASAPSSASYSAWAPHVRPVVQEVAGRFGVSTVLTRPGHSPTQDRAADFMVYRDLAKGDAITVYVLANASRFRVEYVIWKQRIFFPSGTSRAMEDRGSPTANHFDHPHVSFLPG
jgi:LysM repeat protein